MYSSKLAFFMSGTVGECQAHPSMAEGCGRFLPGDSGNLLLCTCSASLLIPLLLFVGGRATIWY